MNDGRIPRCPKHGVLSHCATANCELGPRRWTAREKEGQEGIYRCANLERDARSSLLLTDPTRKGRLDGATEKC